MSKNLERVHYTLSFEEGQMVRRGRKRISGHEVTIYNNYSRLPADAQDSVFNRLLEEVAEATQSDRESVRNKLYDNYNEACRKIVANANNYVFSAVPVEVISYTIDPRRLRIRFDEMPIRLSQN